MQDKILNWFANGEVGMSSKAMACAIGGVKLKEGKACYPHDPADFNRCLLFLKAVPEAREHLQKVAKLSKVWKAIIERFDEIEKCFLKEVGINWKKGNRAPKTYELMKSIIKPPGGF